MSSFRINILEHAVAQPAVEGFYNDPPTHSAGYRVIVGESPTGDFNGHSNKIAWSNGINWFFDEPVAGWNTWVNSEDKRCLFDGTNWETWEHIHLHEMDSNNSHATQVANAHKVLGWDEDGKPAAKPSKQIPSKQIPSKEYTYKHIQQEAVPPVANYTAGNTWTREPDMAKFELLQINNTKFWIQTSSPKII